jgi:GT2 family glycosyltransferase
VVKVHHRIRDVFGSGGLYIADNRNRLVKRFLDETDGEWLWSLDSDIEFTGQTLDLLLTAAGEGPRLIAAPYWSDYATGRYLTWLRADETGFLAFSALPDPGVYELAACGMGCTLIHRDVLETIRVGADERDPWTWFAHDLVLTGKGWMRAGEDVGFCVRARQAGYPPYGLSSALVKHHKVYALD